MAARPSAHPPPPPPPRRLRLPARRPQPAAASARPGPARARQPTTQQRRRRPGNGRRRWRRRGRCAASRPSAGLPGHRVPQCVPCLCVRPRGTTSPGRPRGGAGSRPSGAPRGAPGLRVPLPEGLWTTSPGRPRGGGGSWRRGQAGRPALGSDRPAPSRRFSPLLFFPGVCALTPRLSARRPPPPWRPWALLPLLVRRALAGSSPSALQGGKAQRSGA